MNLKIFAIDEKQENLIPLKMFITKIFPMAKIMTTLNGSGIMDMIHADDPDIVLLGIDMMTGMDGLAFCRRIKEDIRLCLIPVVFMIASATGKEKRMDAVKAGADGFLSMPLDEAEMIVQIHAMSKIKAANKLRRMEKEKWDALVEERIQELEQELSADRKRKEELQIAHQRLLDIIEFLPDATFVIDQDKKVIAWNRACEIMTGIKKESVLGLGDYVYAEPFFGERRPILVDLLDMPSPDLEARYKYIQRIGETILAESFIPRLRRGQGAHLWGVAAPLFDQKGQRCGAIEVIRDVTEQKQVEQALRESELKHRMLFETANDAIILMQQDCFRDCNARTLTMFGCSREQIVGASPYKYSPPKQPDGRCSQEKAMEKIDLALTKGPQFFEWEHCRLDGTPFMAEVSLNRIEMGGDILLQAIVRDISERKKAEESAKLSAKHIHFLSKYANDFIILLDENFRFLEVNDRMVDFYGYTHEELIGMHASQLRTPETKKQFISQIDIARVSGKAVFETMHRRKDGRQFPVEISLRAIENEGKRLYQAIIRDITERKESERALQEKDRAEAADRLKSAFLATMSHELRTPLNSIIGFTGILLQDMAGPLNAEQKKQLGMIQSSSRHLLSLINDVLDISKIEAGQLEVRKEPFNLQSLLVKIAGVVRPLAEKKGLSLQVELSPEIGFCVSDSRRVEQILLNLLNNAVKFTQLGMVTLRAEIVPGIASQPSIRISVSDTGIGIKLEDLSKLFQPFRQIDSGLSRQHEGTGLGLAICSRLIQMLGGEIHVTSEWGKGSIFTFTLPLEMTGNIS